MASPGGADSGDLDPTFDFDGKVTTDFAGGPDGANAVAIQANGRIVAVGTGTVGGKWNFHSARYNPDGSLDNTFGIGGRVSTGFGSGEDFAYAVAIQADGKIVAAGCTFCALGVADFALVRYNVDGSLDATFGIGGKMTTDFSGRRDGAFAVAIQADGKIVAAGCTACEQVAGDFAIARYNSDGSLDTTLDGDGKVTTDLNGGEDHGNAVAIQGDGRIVAAGARSELTPISAWPDTTVTVLSTVPSALTGR